jgi:hypothetical protein
VFTARYGLNINTQLRPFLFSPRRFGLHPGPVHVRFMVHTAALLHVSLPVLQFPCQYHSTDGTRSLSSTCCSYQKDKRAKCWNVPKSSALSQMVRSWRCAVLAHSLQWVIDVSVFVPCFQFAVYVCLLKLSHRLSCPGSKYYCDLRKVTVSAVS